MIVGAQYPLEGGFKAAEFLPNWCAYRIGGLVVASREIP